MTGKRCCDKCHGHCHRVAWWLTWWTGSSVEPLLPNAWLQPSRRKDRSQELGCKRPQACFQLFSGLRALSLSLFSLDRASLSKGLLQLLTLHEKRGILTINPSSVSQILPQPTLVLSKHLPNRSHHSKNQTCGWGNSKLSSQVDSNPAGRKPINKPLHNPASKPALPKPGAELGHLLCPFHVFQDFFLQLAGLSTALRLMVCWGTAWGRQSQPHSPKPFFLGTITETKGHWRKALMSGTD